MDFSKYEILQGFTNILISHSSIKDGTFSKIAANNFLKPQNCIKNLENLAIWDKLPDFILENFATAQVKLGQFQNFKKS